MVVGLISDTHGLLRPEALAALTGVDLILHAGDIGSADVMKALSAAGRVVFIRGNIDGGAWASHLPERETIDVEGVRIHMLHDVKALDPAALPDGTRLVLSGHSHQPKIEERGGVLYVNPGSAGPRRFSLPVTIGRLHVAGGDVT